MIAGLLKNRKIPQYSYEKYLKLVSNQYYYMALIKKFEIFVACDQSVVKVYDWDHMDHGEMARWH